MSRFFISLFTIFFIHHQQVSSYWLVKFPIIKDEIKEYVDNIERIIEDNSGVLANDDNSLLNKYNIETIVNQIQLAIDRLTVTTTIQNNIKETKKCKKRDNAEHFFRGTGSIYKNFKNDLINLIQLYNEDYNLFVYKIHARINYRKWELECIRARFIRYENEPDKSIFTHFINIYRSMDAILWCGENDFSWQLTFFNFFYDMVINELRIFLMDVADYVLLLCYSQNNNAVGIDQNNKDLESQLFNRDSVRITISEKKDDLIYSIKQYTEALKWAMAVSRKNIYQCTPENFKKGKTYLELANTIISEGPRVEYCDESSDVYEWRRQEQADEYSSDIPCRNKRLIKIKLHPSGKSKLSAFIRETCVRACSVDPPNVNDLRTISLLEQTSDVEENMVVTNIKFVEENSLIQIQIEQGQLKKLNTYVIEDNRNWKPLQDVQKLVDTTTNTIQFYTVGNTDEKNILTEGIHYANIDSNHKTLNLDDVILPSGYVITGVRFGYSEILLDEIKPLEIQIQGTLYNVETNELITVLDDKPTSFWVTPKLRSSLLPGYDRARTEYEMNVAGHPFETNGKSNSESNQYVNFIRSEWLIHYRHRTLPFFDARPTFSNIPLPLGGISLFIKGAKGAETFLTLNTLPYVITQILNSNS